MKPTKLAIVFDNGEESTFDAGEGPFYVAIKGKFINVKFENVKAIRINE